MTKSTDLDSFRGMAGKRAAQRRRETRGVALDQAELRARRTELEKNLFAAKAADWSQAIDKARYLMSLLGEASSDPRVRRMIEAALTDFETLLAKENRTTDGATPAPEEDPWPLK
jgi:hypothetical protein